MCKTILAFTAAAMATSIAAQDSALKVTYLDEAKITVNARPREDGFMRVRIVPEGGTPREATVGISARMRENDLARGIADALNAVLGPDYIADKDAGEHVKIRKKERGTANFSVEITFNAPGFAVVLDE